jgi:hypothetical protein
MLMMQCHQCGTLIALVIHRSLVNVVRKRFFFFVAMARLVYIIQLENYVVFYTPETGAKRVQVIENLIIAVFIPITTTKSVAIGRIGARVATAGGAIAATSDVAGARASHAADARVRRADGARRHVAPRTAAVLCQVCRRQVGVCV